MHAGLRSLAPIFGLVFLACIEEPDLEGRQCDLNGTCPAPFVCDRERKCVRNEAIAPDAGALDGDALASDAPTDSPPPTSDAGISDAAPRSDALPRREDATPADADERMLDAQDGATPDAVGDASMDASNGDAAPADGMTADAMTADAMPKDAAAGEITESNASDWGAGSSPYPWSELSSPRCLAQLLVNGAPEISSVGIAVSDDTAKVAEGAGSIVVDTTDLGFTYFWFYPRTIDAAMDLGQTTEIAISIDAENPGPVGWQGFFPAIYLCSASGSFRELYPSVNLLPVAPSIFSSFVVPIAGGTAGGVSWIARDGGPTAFDPSSVAWIELEADTWDSPPTRVWIDGLRFR